ncbi:MAG: hypothetical protein LH615_03785, partial [Ferruginibacter sp.]|nr:hypothetical protein [Ferruginibacter sp.]
MLISFSGFVWMVVAQQIQRYNSFRYNVNEGLLQSTIGSIAVDKNNFCWISYPNGIQKFDGRNFTIIPVQAGLPDNKSVHFYKCNNGDLLISHSEGISKYEIARNGFTIIYKNAPVETKQAIFIGEDEGIIYFLTEIGTVKGIQLHTLKMITETKTDLMAFASLSNYPPVFSENIINHTVGINVNYKLYLWDLKLCKMLSVSTLLPDISGFMLRLKTDHEILYFSYKINKGIQGYNFSTGKNSILFINGKDDNPIDRCNIFPWKNKLLISFNNRLFVTDTSFTSLHSELVDFQNQSIAGISSISAGGIREDYYGNLYIQTLNGGIKKVIGNNYPVKYYGTLKKEDNNIISLLTDKKNNRILAGAVHNGLLIFDTLQNLLKHIKVLPGKNLPFSPNCIIKNNRGDYILFNVGEKQWWMLKNDFSTLLPGPITSALPENKKGFHYFGNFLFQNKDGAVLQTQGKLYRSSFVNNTVSEHEVSTAYVMGGLLYGNFIIIHGNDELIYLDATTFSEIKRVPLKNTGNVRCFATSKENNIFIGSNNGIYKIDETGKILDHFTK